MRRKTIFRSSHLSKREDEVQHRLCKIGKIGFLRITRQTFFDFSHFKQKFLERPIKILMNSCCLLFLVNILTVHYVSHIGDTGIWLSK